MSFNYNCFYKLSKKKIDSSTYGNIEGPFSQTEIISQGLPLPSSISIIDDIPNTSNTHVVGIPQTNGNNYSKKKIFFFMATYNIPELLSIKPYVSLGGNDTGEGAQDICIDPSIRKKLALLHNRNSLHPLTKNEKFAILARGNINSYRHCIFKS